MSTALSISSASDGLESVYAVARGGSAVSGAANVLRRAASEAVDAVERSHALFGRKAAVIAEIWRLTDECSAAGWDGYGADPVSAEALRRAIALVRALPANVPMPEVGTEPDGSISLEWARSRHSLLSLSVGAAGELPYAWIDGADRGHAVSAYEDGRFPTRVLEQIRSIMDWDDASVRTP